MLKSVRFFIAIVIINLMMVGCSHTESTSITHSEAITHRVLIERLKSSGVQVFQVGNNLTLILPTDVIFIQHTPALNTNYFPVLNNVARLLKAHEKFSIKVAVYTDSIDSAEYDLALSQQQAEMIANYLWKQGIDTRFIYAAGYGQKYPIVKNTAAEGRLTNNRAEISLRLITDNTVD